MAEPGASSGNLAFAGYVLEKWLIGENYRALLKPVGDFFIFMTDPISDFFIRIKNGYLAGKKKVNVQHSKQKEFLANILVKSGYLAKVEIKVKEKEKKDLEMDLLYKDNKAKVTNVVMVSTPGKRVYVKRNKIPKVLGGLGISIISTPQGFMTDREARKKNLGGELFCKIW